jgi:Flp pilus assembly protein TadG
MCDLTNKSTLAAGFRRRARSGAAIVEMTAVLVVLMGLTFGCIEFGDAFFKKNTLQGAAREGARVAIISGKTSTDVNNAVTAVMTAAGIPVTNPAKYTITITDANTDSAINFSTVSTGTPIKVTVSGKWKNLGIAPFYLSKEKDITGVAVMRREG